MTKTEILNYLELITGELTDAHHLTDTDGTVDANYSVNSAQELVDELRHNIENNIEKDPRGEYEFNEAMNGIVLAGDGEGRLKGSN